MCIEQQLQQNLPLCVKFNRIAGHILEKKKERKKRLTTSLERPGNTLFLNKKERNKKFNSISGQKVTAPNSTHFGPNDCVCLCCVTFPITEFRNIKLPKKQAFLSLFKKPQWTFFGSFYLQAVICS